MKLKRILTSALATLVAVSAMAISSSAALVTFKTADDAGGKPDPNIFQPDITGIDHEKVDVIQVDMTVNSGYVNGFIGTNSIEQATWYDSGQQEINGEESGMWQLKGIGGLALDENGGSTLKVELWWINPVYGEDPDGDGEEEAPVVGPGIVEITAVRFYDVNMNELKAEAAETPDTTTPDTDTDTTTPDTTNSGTGIESVAAISAVALIAGGAIVASRKRK